MRTMTARRDGVCSQCARAIDRGESIGYEGADRYSRRVTVLCPVCLAQYRRDLAADDMDMMTGGY